MSKPTPAELGALPNVNPVIAGTPEVSGNGYSGYRMRATHTSCPPARRFTILEKAQNGGNFNIITRGEDGKNDGVFTFPAGQSGEVFHTGRPPTKGQLAEGIINGQVISTGDHGLVTMQVVISGLNTPELMVLRQLTATFSKMVLTIHLVVKVFESIQVLQTKRKVIPLTLVIGCLVRMESSQLRMVFKLVLSVKPM